MTRLSVEHTLAKAKACAKKGEVIDAQGHYLNILKQFPKNKKALQGLSFLKINNQLNINNRIPKNIIDDFNNMVNIGQLEKVSKETRNLILHYPREVSLWNILGVASAQLKNFDEAIDSFKAVISIDPNQASSYYNLGNVLKDQNKFDEATIFYTKALKIMPDYKAAYTNLVTLLAIQGLANEAKKMAVVKNYHNALIIKGDNADKQFGLANVLHGEGKLDEALIAYEKVISLWPSYAPAYYNMGIVLSDQGKPEQALSAYRNAVAKKPDYAEAYCNMGIALSALGNLTEAIDAYNKALEIQPNSVFAHNNLGLAFANQGKLREALCAYRKVLEIDDQHADANHNISYALLSLKDFKKGFKQSEWRWKTDKFQNSYLKSTKPAWNGEEGKRVLIWAEQGIGDEIMFASIFRDIHTVSSKIIIQCDERLIPLFQRSFPQDFIYFKRNQIVPEDMYDAHIPMGSLTVRYRQSQECFAASAAGFLTCDSQRSENIRRNLLNKYDKKIIGISWKTASPLTGSFQRNITLEDLAKSFDYRNYQLLSLQYGDVSQEIEDVKKKLGIEVLQLKEVDNKNDLDGLASLIMACDHIVSTTNATVHLAGALGARATALLPFTPRWIWGADAESYWYSSISPIKQRSAGNWKEVLDCLSTRLRANKA